VDEAEANLIKAQTQLLTAVQSAIQELDTAHTNLPQDWDREASEAHAHLNELKVELRKLPVDMNKVNKLAADASTALASARRHSRTALRTIEKAMDPLRDAAYACITAHHEAVFGQMADQAHQNRGGER